MPERDEIHQQFYEAARSLVPNFVIDWLVPLPVYFVLRLVTNELTALAAAAAIPTVHTLILGAWRRQVDWIGILAIVGFSGGLAAALLGGGTLSLKIAGPLITGGLGLLFLISVAIRKPIVITILKSLDIGDPRRFGNPVIYRRAALITLVFGLVFFYDAFAHVVFALTVPTDTYVIVDRVITLTDIVILVVVIRTILHRRTRDL